MSTADPAWSPPSARSIPLESEVRENDGHWRWVLEQELNHWLLVAGSPAVVATAVHTVSRTGSLMAMEMRNALAARMGVKLPATLLFDQPSVGALAAFLANGGLAELVPGASGTAIKLRNCSCRSGFSLTLLALTILISHKFSP